MKLVLQRVSQASVSVDNQELGAIDRGLLVYVGFQKSDDFSKIQKTIAKIPQLRLFPDETGRMNRSLIDVGGSILLISQFTLISDCRKGLRPFFGNAEQPERAKELYELTIEFLKALNVPVQSGSFGADMIVQSSNGGPVTLVLDDQI